MLSTGENTDTAGALAPPLRAVTDLQATSALRAPPAPARRHGRRSALRALGVLEAAMLFGLVCYPGPFALALPGAGENLRRWSSLRAAMEKPQDD